ncbi:prepilin peptidase [Patescibacteria group bacterium]|nr:prepilin peptidase [Patescibacteria group bacterium]MBU4512288.1 prepilin peptidase [Patescibacteria group bacterium]MCG2693642.1 prepilin peptidase [Candidatus Parcubacteria bacterium]
MFFLITFILGLAIGSFLNAVIWRLHSGESIARGRSKCPKCRHKLKWQDNIPLASFVVLRGKCRYCHKKISWQYPLVELATALLFVLAYSNSGLPEINYQLSIINYQLFQIAGALLQGWFIISILIIIFVYDFRWYLVDDRVVLPAIGLIFIWNIWLGKSWLGLAISGIIIAGFFWLQFLASRGKWIGSGDIRLGLLMGVILGWPLGLVALFLSYIIGSLVSVALLIIGRKKFTSKIPLGPFLMAGTIIVMFWGEKIMGWYMRLM